ncbi:MAG: hypothetical protein WCH84_00910 [Verrucomicrobiota bacterium]
MKPRKYLSWPSGWALLVALTVSSPAHAAIKLHDLISDGAVLQQGTTVPIWGTANDGESVTVKFQNQSVATTAQAGRWLIKLQPLQPGGPFTLTVTGTNTVEVKELLVGEVWVGSGQSNMELPSRFFSKGDAVLAAWVAAAPYPQLRLFQAKTKWQPATPENLNGFSALLFAFGLRLQKVLGVPVGLIVGAVGGTPSGPWLSAAALHGDAACQELIQQYAATKYGPALQQYDRELADWKLAAATAQQQNKSPARQPPPLPKPGTTRDDPVGSFYEAFIYSLMPYAIRGVLWDQGEAGTGLAGVDQFTLMGALIRGWRKDWAQSEFPFIYIQKPSGGGCAWDYADPVTKNADPFVPQPPGVPAFGIPELETHLRIRQYPNVGMVGSSDLGNGLHPQNKSGYGQRAAAVALGMVYVQKIEYSGPIYASHKLEGSKVRIQFTHVGRGLAFRHGDKLQGFAVAGANKVFSWADAKIDGATVVLSCPQVPQPVAIRYAWVSLRPWANLFNQDGLPALPFNIDFATVNEGT